MNSNTTNITNTELKKFGYVFSIFILLFFILILNFIFGIHTGKVFDEFLSNQLLKLHIIKENDAW